MTDSVPNPKIQWDRAYEWMTILLYLIYALCISFTLIYFSSISSYRFFDELLCLLLPPIFYIAMYHSRLCIYTCCLIGFSSCSSSLMQMIHHPYPNLKLTAIFMIAILFAVEIIYHTAYRQRKLHAQLRELANRYQDTLEKIKILSEILPICSICSKLRTDEEAWTEFENYLYRSLDADIVKGICKECAREMAKNLSTDPDEE